VDTCDEIEDIIIGECIRSATWEVYLDRTIDPIDPIAEVYVIDIIPQYLIFVHPSLDPECTDCLIDLLSDGTPRPSIVCVLEILFCECRAATYDPTCLDIVPYASELPTYIDATMFTESLILHSDDRIKKSPRETPFVWSHVSTRGSLISQDGTMSISEDETAV
jgi:hypothetical protein